ncbi:Wzz/FepE/Etk N-terminal domain-containing protein [Ruania halotolerans]|uniref:Wzz/FepE/Etk N-terminal domain-containing protein n=1 Tax=Ruania halotolerans TaxID=2897773 RepID=UPI001E4FCD3C|nr:Wzz/FepE/Etk N-terminal domain-containing protein [Ruania halotolerans]UFU05723.1 Wzz/FepE/Etk N-terminal domain-containing protein [Ruania halotolerans]
MGETPESTLAHYGATLRGRWLLILVVTVIGAALAASYLVVTPATYSATASVQINVIASDPFQSSQSASDLIDGSTEASIATSYSVASLASAQFDTPRSPNEIREASEATPVADATVLQISYTAHSPESARDGADGIAAAYLDYREAQARARLSSMIEMIDDQLTGLRQDLVRANAASAAAEPGSSEANQAESDRELVTIEINSLITRKNVLESINTVGGVILSPAQENPLETAPNVRTIAASGVLGGLLLGLVLAFLANKLDRRVGSRAEIALITGAGVIVALPGAESRIPARDGDLAGLRLARELILVDLPKQTRRIVILDHTPAPADVAANLAMVFAQDRSTVDLVLPAPDEISTELVVAGLELEPTRTAGLLQEYECPVVPTLTVAIGGAGTEITEPDPIITAAVRQRLTGTATADLRFVTVSADAPAPSRLAAERHCEAAVLVVVKDSTHTDRINDSIAELAASGVPLLAVITVPRSRTRPHPLPSASDRALREGAR